MKRQAENEANHHTPVVGGIASQIKALAAAPGTEKAVADFTKRLQHLNEHVDAGVNPTATAAALDSLRIEVTNAQEAAEVVAREAAAAAE